MIKAKQVNINKYKYYKITINDLDPFLLDIKKKFPKDIDFHYINYIQENFNNSNSLRIKIDSATGYFKEKNDEKYLILDSKNMKEFGPKLNHKLKELMVEKTFSMKKITVKLTSILKIIYP